VAIEVSLSQPAQVASLFLIAPGGSLIAEATPDLRAFIEAEGAALARDDLNSAVEANLVWWVEGPQRSADDVDPTVRNLVRRMQRRAFEVTAGWDGVEERELDPPALDRLAEIQVPTLVLVGAWISRRSTTRHGAWLSALPARGASTGRAPPTCPRWNAPRTSSRCCATGCHPGHRRTRRDASMRTTRGPQLARSAEHAPTRRPPPPRASPTSWTALLPPLPLTGSVTGTASSRRGRRGGAEAAAHLRGGAGHEGPQVRHERRLHRAPCFGCASAR
jgi:hypothetical protein